MKRFVKLFASCIVVKGVHRGFIYDLQRPLSSCAIPLDLCDVLDKHHNKSIEDIKNHYRHKYDETIEEYFQFLLSENFAYCFEKQELVRFPPINMDWISPSLVINKGVEIFNTCGIKLLLILLSKNLIEDILKAMVIFFRDGILRCKPDILLSVKRKVKAASCKGCNGFINIVKSLNNTRGALKLMDKLTGFVTLGIGNNKLTFRAVGNLHFGVFVNVTVGVTGNGNGLCPGGDKGGNALYNNGSAENGTV